MINNGENWGNQTLNQLASQIKNLITEREKWATGRLRCKEA